MRLLWLVLLLDPFVPALGQVEATPPPGHKGPIARERLIHDLQVQTVEGYVVSGEDLRAAIAELRGDHDVQLSRCVIEGGLRFEGTVPVRLEISDCEVRSAPLIRGPWAATALYAREARFAEDVNFTGTKFDGKVVLIGAQFDEKVSFAGSALGSGADFTGARFSDNAHFNGAVFKGARFDGAMFARRADFGKATFLDGARFEASKFESLALFSRATFEGEQRIQATFHERVDFRGVTFTREALFSTDGQRPGARFRGEVDFSEAVFGAKADFSGVSFPAQVSFKGGVFEGPGSFADTRFRADTRFEDTGFEDDANFSGAIFEGGASFSAATFGARADFERAEFTEDAVFKGAELEGAGVFTYARFRGASYFNLARFRDRAVFFDSVMGGDVTFEDAVIEGRASFLRAAFGGRADFSKARFHDRAYLADAAFAGDAFFRDARFEGGEAVFRGAAFGGLLDFQNVKAVGVLDLASTSYGAYADFRDAHIRTLDVNSSERPAIVAARFDMRGARVDEAHFEDVIFEDETDFSDAIFGVDGQDARAGGTVLRFVTFEESASFARARFSGRFALEKVKFQGRADFTDADLSGIAEPSPPSFSLSYVTFNDLHLKWSQLPPPEVWVRQSAQRIGTTLNTTSEESALEPLEPLSRVFERLEASFRDRGQLADANQAYYHRKRTELVEARREGLTVRRLWLEVQWVLWGATAGYGTRLGWIVGWTVLVDVLFALIYWRAAVIRREPHPETEPEHSFRPRLLDLPKQYLTEKSERVIRSRLLDALRASSVILLKVGYRDITLSGRLGGVKLDYVVRLQWALGYLLLAALAVTLANTQPLLNRLLTGIF